MLDKVRELSKIKPRLLKAGVEVFQVQRDLTPPCFPTVT